ncbi:MAG: serine hydrolase [Acidobacteriota bacterium]|nr:serine hydrolase [Acidobacteriota bacterium]
MIRFFLLMLISATGFAADTDALKAEIQKLTADQKATYGIAYHNLTTGEELLINAHDRMHAASTMKVPVMMQLFAKMERGELDLKRKLPVVNKFKSIVDGSPYTISTDWERELHGKEGEEVPIEEMIRLMIVRSSNLATNILIALADAKQTTALMRGFGAKNIQVLRGVEDIKAFEAGLSNESTAHDMMKVMIACATSPAFKQSSREKMLAILRGQEDRKTIPAGLPEDAVVANKTGAISRVQHDAAVVDLPDGTRYVLVIFARDFDDQRPRVIETGAAISRAVYRHVAGR